MATDIDTEILDRFRELYVDCPECEGIWDDQYQCMTCGGSGHINVLEYLKENYGFLTSIPE